jgi:hypothetical protein
MSPSLSKGQDLSVITTNDKTEKGHSGTRPDCSFRIIAGLQRAIQTSPLTRRRRLRPLAADAGKHQAHISGHYYFLPGSLHPCPVRRISECTWIVRWLIALTSLGRFWGQLLRCWT